MLPAVHGLQHQQPLMQSAREDIVSSCPQGCKMRLWASAVKVLVLLFDPSLGHPVDWKFVYMYVINNVGL